MMSIILGFQRSIAVLGTFQSGALLELQVALINAYNIKVLLFLWRSIDMGCILFHVKFEVGLSISVSEIKAVLRIKK